MSTLHSKAISVVLVACAAVPATVHAVNARLEARAIEGELSTMTAALETFAPPKAGARDVTLNGARTIVRATTESASVERVMANVARECESSDPEVAFGIRPDAGEGALRPRISLERTVSQESTSGARATLCIFGGSPSDAPGATHRARYTLAHRIEDGRTNVVTVSNLSSAPLAALFPAEGDAPGSDLPGVARPARSRRTLTAIVGEDEYSVRIYESTLSLGNAIESYDDAMSALGFERTAALSESRMYRQRGTTTSVVASFRGLESGCAVTIAPFGPGHVAPPGH